MKASHKVKNINHQNNKKDNLQSTTTESTNLKNTVWLINTANQYTVNLYALFNKLKSVHTTKTVLKKKIKDRKK